MIKLNKLVSKLEYELGGVNLKIETLNNVNFEFGQLRASIEEDEFCIIDLTNKIKLLDDLLTYTMDSLNKDFQNTTETTNAIFNIIIKNKH